MELAGLEPRKVLDGLSLVSLLKGTGPLRRNTLYFHYPNYAFHKRNRLGSAIREGDYKLIRRYDDGSLELYDLSNDLGERINLADELPLFAQRLNGKLARWLGKVGAVMPQQPSP